MQASIMLRSPLLVPEEKSKAALSMDMAAPVSPTKLTSESPSSPSIFSTVTSLFDSPTESHNLAPHLPTRDADIIIVGAGVAGCAAAVAFGRQGRKVILFEKCLQEPNRVSGELLQPGGVKALSKLGLDDCLEGIEALLCYGYHITYNGESVEIKYPERRDPQGTLEAGRSFRHGRFVQKLRQAAIQTPNVTVIENKVTDVIQDWPGDKVLGVITDGGTGDKRYRHYFASLVIISDGYTSTFRKRFLPNRPISDSKFWALKLLNAELPSPQHGHVILSDGPPILLYQIDKTTTRIFMDVPKGLPSADPSAGGVRAHMLNVVLPVLPAGCQQSFREAVAQGKFPNMPNCYLPDSEQTTPGLMILGDAMNMRHPLTGAGMTVALKDVLLISDLLSPIQIPSLENTEAVLGAIKRFHWARKASSSTINVLAMSLYPVFASNDPALSVLKNGLFRYFQRGGRRVEESCGMLAGLVDDQAVLMRQIIMVLCYSIWMRVCEVPLWKKPWVVFVEAFLVLWRTILLLGPYLNSEIRG